MQRVTMQRVSGGVKLKVTASERGCNQWTLLNVQPRPAAPVCDRRKPPRVGTRQPRGLLCPHSRALPWLGQPARGDSPGRHTSPGTQKALFNLPIAVAGNSTSKPLSHGRPICSGPNAMARTQRGHWVLYGGRPHITPPPRLERALTAGRAAAAVPVVVVKP